MIIYWLKQAVGALLAPMTIVWLLGLLALLCRLRGKRRAAVWLGASTAALAYIFCSVPVADRLLAPLERKYAPLNERHAVGTRYIVVLGSGYTPRGEIPVSAALDDDGLVRIVEGIRLKRRLPGAMLVVCGGAPAGRSQPAQGYALLARELGIDPEGIVVLDRALDTGSEARSIAQLVGEEPFVLVTSAYHMVRAMELMKRNGLRPFPAPTGHRVGSDEQGFDVRSLLPTSVGLRKTERALHEYAGLLALRISID